jgi:hypothetical protein
MADMILQGNQQEYSKTNNPKKKILVRLAKILAE